MRAGLIAGSVAAVAAVLLSLPLHSPSDTLFNSAAVAVTAIAAGVAVAVLWRRLSGAHHLRHFAATVIALFAATAVALIVGEAQLERMLEFGLPLAALIFAVTGVLTPLLDRAALPTR
jgi:hypothetical protein